MVYFVKPKTIEILIIGYYMNKLMYKIFAVAPESMNYGDSVYGDVTYGTPAITTTHTGVDATQNQDSGAISTIAGQDIMLFIGLGLLVIGAVLALVLRRKKKTDVSSIHQTFPHYPNLG